jgi:hypothetical protein
MVRSVSTSKYEGSIKLPSGKKIDFTIKGATQPEVKHLLRDAQPHAKVSMKKKIAKRVPKKKVK